VFPGEHSHNSVSDHEKTPTNNEQALSNKLLQIDSKKLGGGGDKTKDPYYFTFFNEKNEPKKQPECQ
jgi:hypothetical protein